MKRIIREVKQDLKDMGIHMWIIPLVSLAFLGMTFVLQRRLDATGTENLLTLAMLEALIPSLGGYGSLMLMQGLFDTEGGELLFSYPRSRLYWGIIRQIRFFILFMGLTAIVCALTASILRVDFVPIFTVTAIQSFAVMAVAFLSVTWSKNLSVGLIILISFVSVQIMVGRDFTFLNRIYVLTGAAPDPEQVRSISFNGLLIGIFGWVLGHVWLRPR
jgi:hypothetical protein